MSSRPPSLEPTYNSTEGLEPSAKKRRLETPSPVASSVHEQAQQQFRIQEQEIKTSPITPLQQWDSQNQSSQIVNKIRTITQRLNTAASLNVLCVKRIRQTLQGSNFVVTQEPGYPDSYFRFLTQLAQVTPFIMAQSIRDPQRAPTPLTKDQMSDLGKAELKRWFYSLPIPQRNIPVIFEQLASPLLHRDPIESGNIFTLVNWIFERLQGIDIELAYNILQCVTNDTTEIYHNMQQIVQHKMQTNWGGLFLHWIDNLPSYTTEHGFGSRCESQLTIIISNRGVNALTRIGEVSIPMLSALLSKLGQKSPPSSADAIQYLWDWWIENEAPLTTPDTHGNLPLYYLLPYNDLDLLTHGIETTLEQLETEEERNSCLNECLYHMILSCETANRHLILKIAQHEELDATCDLATLFERLRKEEQYDKCYANIEALIPKKV
jgi:hypothetical protein